VQREIMSLGGRDGGWGRLKRDGAPFLVEKFIVGRTRGGGEERHRGKSNVGQVKGGEGGFSGEAPLGLKSDWKGIGGRGWGNGKKKRSYGGG